MSTKKLLQATKAAILNLLYFPSSSWFFNRAFVFALSLFLGSMNFGCLNLGYSNFDFWTASSEAGLYLVEYTAH